MNSKNPSIQEFIDGNQYPGQWLEFEMYPAELFEVQLGDFEGDFEGDGEHFRYGAFQWWIAQPMSLDQLVKLVALAYLDPDQVMASSARKDILGRVPDLPNEMRVLLDLRTGCA